MTTWLRELDASGSGPRLAVKDCIDVAGVPTTAGCPAFPGGERPARRDAAVVATARAQGARIVGKTNLDELCWSADGVNPWTGTPRNPLDPLRIPGGSSSGSAVAVATGQADVGYGTDTGGSVRIPAACCGIAGLKTTYGRIPRDGVLPLARSLDTVGPLGIDVAAVELGMRLLEPGFAADRTGGDLAVGRIRQDEVEVDPRIDAAVDVALRAAGFDVVDAPVASWREGRVGGDLLLMAEGYREHHGLLTAGDRLGDRLRRRIEVGGGITDAGLRRAERARRALLVELDELFARYPVLALPTLPAEPPRIEAAESVGLTALTVVFNLTGLPVLALPVPRPDGGFVASVQLVGPPHAEERLLEVGYRVQAAIEIR